MFKCRKENIMKLHKTVNKNKGIKLMQFFFAMKVKFQNH